MAHIDLEKRPIECAMMTSKVNNYFILPSHLPTNLVLAVNLSDFHIKTNILLWLAERGNEPSYIE